MNDENCSGRYDIKIPIYVIEQLTLSIILEPILMSLRSIMPNSSNPILRTHNIVFVPAGSPTQQWHYDDDSNDDSYFTILINLTFPKNCGGTEIWNDSLKKGDLVSKLINRRYNFL